MAWGTYDSLQLPDGFLTQTGGYVLDTRGTDSRTQSLVRKPIPSAIRFQLQHLCCVWIELCLVHCGRGLILHRQPVVGAMLTGVIHMIHLHNFSTALTPLSKAPSPSMYHCLWSTSQTVGVQIVLCLLHTCSSYNWNTSCHPKDAKKSGAEASCLPPPDNCPLPVKGLPLFSV
jgi:hypothetical protein